MYELYITWPDGEVEHADNFANWAVAVNTQRWIEYKLGLCAHLVEGLSYDPDNPITHYKRLREAGVIRTVYAG